LQNGYKLRILGCFKYLDQRFKDQTLFIEIFFNNHILKWDKKKTTMTYNTSYEHLKSWEWSWQNDSWPCNPLIKGSIKSLANWEAYLWLESIFQRLQFCHWELSNQRHNENIMNLQNGNPFITWQPWGSWSSKERCDLM
jgi:hypothetical protein